jgi:hypothetical protein
MWLSACGGGSGVPVVAQVTIVTDTPSAAVGQQAVFTATAFDKRGKQIGTASITWQSSTPTVATIGNNGSAMGLLPGTTQITASSGGVSSMPMTFTVTPGFLLTGSMANPRTSPTTTVLNNGMILIVGGENESGLNQSFVMPAELYNPATGTFTTTGSLNEGRFQHTATLLNNGMVLITGGFGPNEVPLTSAELYNPATGTFTETGHMNVGRYEHTATLLQSGKVLIAGGPLDTSAEIFDPVTQTFAFTGNLNVLRYNHSSVLLNDGEVLLIAGLSSGGLVSSAELFNPLTGSFTPTGGLLSGPRDFFTAALLIDGTVLVAGGSGATTLNDAEIYNLATKTFSETSALNTARFSQASALLTDGQVLIMGGQTSGAGAAASGSELYDPTSGTFSVTGPLSAGRAPAACALLANGNVLVVGGAAANSLTSAEVYEPGTFTPPSLQSITITGTEIAAGTAGSSPGTYAKFRALGMFSGGGQGFLNAANWTTSDSTTAQIGNDITNPGTAVVVGSPSAAKSITITATVGTISATTTMNVRPAGFVASQAGNLPREFFTATTVNDGTVLVNGGTVAQPLNSAFYVPAQQIFIAAGVPAVPNRTDSTATLLPNGKVLMVGGNNGNTFALTSAELYDPITTQFSPTGSLNFGRYFHTATLLPSGKVLITGGQTTDSNWLNSAELYDPATGTFSITGSLNFPRGGHTATLLSDGTVLVAGGQTIAGGFLTDNEIYDPSSGTFSTTGSLATGREFQTATLLANGSVLVAGGVDNVGSVASAELYNVATKTFTSAGNLVTSRFFHTATLLVTGKVLFTGGVNTALGTLSSAEVYDPVAGSFTPAGNMTTARESHAAALMDNGQVLIYGGAGATVLGSAELY